MGLLLVEAGRRRRRDASGQGAADATGKDCESGSTDEGSTQPRDRDQKPFPESQGQLQGVLGENQQLRDQLGQLRAHNAALASQLQEQYVESARCLAGISASLEDDPHSGGALAAARMGLYDVHDLRGEPKQRSLPAPRRSGAGPLMGAPGSHGRASRASSSGSSSGGSHARRASNASPEGTLSVGLAEGLAEGLAPWEYSDHADLCDSGFWSLQASPPRSSSVLAGAGIGVAPAAAHTPARLCWLGRSPTPPPVGVPGMAPPHITPSGATAFILNARRPRPHRH